MNPLLVAILVASALGSALPAQQPAQKPVRSRTVREDDEKTRIILDVTRVNILLAVTDKKGRFITELGKNDFEVIENKRPQEIMEFTAETDLPLRIAILVDSSNSVRERFRFIQEAAIEFINSVIRPGQDKALVVSFDTSTELVADLDDNLEKLANTIRDLRAGGGTSLYDAIFFACRDKLGMEQPRHKFRRAMVILSDGEDNQSEHTRDQALEVAQKADVVIFTISTNYTRIDTDGDKVLKYLATETGGQAFFPFKVEDLSQSFENIANELRHQYNIFYRPEPLMTDGRYQPINVKVKGRKDLVVRARKGYYAPRF
jgi:Ca-activated chloride channel family protein